jgi:hypothetical protein
MNENYIRFKVANPKDFSKLNIEVIGKDIKAVKGIMADGVSKIQSIIFPSAKFSISDAKSWVRSHGYKIQEVYLVEDIILNPKNFELTFIEEIFTEPIVEPKKQTNWLDKYKLLYEGESQ